jgi:hypothetical protein
MNPLCAKNLKTNYNVSPYGDHGTERVKQHAITHVQVLVTFRHFSMLDLCQSLESFLAISQFQFDRLYVANYHDYSDGMKDI